MKKYEIEGCDFYSCEDMEVYFDLNRSTLLKHLSQEAVPPVCKNASLEVLRSLITEKTRQLQLIAPVAEKMLETHNDNMSTIETQGKRILELESQ
jgi:hypothetical protein